MKADLKTIAKESKRLNEKRDCAVRAVTAISNLPYHYVHKAFADSGRIRGHVTQFTVTEKTLKKLNIWIEPHTFTAKTIVSLGKELPKKGRYLVRTSGHILAAVDGEIMDWTKGRRHRIKQVYKVSF